jgi:DNA replication licensing factor MCM7
MRHCSAYIALARRCRPVIPADVSSYIVESYVRLRKQSKDDAQINSHTHVSARTLLGVIRLTQALARLRFATTVLHADIDEALRLMVASKESLHDGGEGDADTGGEDHSDTHRIYRIIKDMVRVPVAASPGRMRKRPRRHGPDREGDVTGGCEGDAMLHSLSMVDIRAHVLRAGYTEAQLTVTIQEVRLQYLFHLFADADILFFSFQYEDLNIWTCVDDGSNLRFA